jgi:hypothetical protein
LLSLLQEQHEYSIIGMACMALGAMEVKGAADFFEATDHIADLFQVDFRRAVPLIQQLVERTGVKGYDPRKAKQPPRPPLAELEEPLYELYKRFGTKGLFLLLEELDITSKYQVDFILDAVTEVSYRVKGREEAERQAIVKELKQWLQSRVQHLG